MKIKCPKCGKETRLEDNPFRPFCSERCKLLDLGNWLSGSYSIPTVKDQEEDKPADPPKESGDS
ncbi:MAG: DNA gyrase inhibitor YacG [Acidobacteriia bacterium]|nr:DNA gyrase inhibitor YacG [Terriglobia bacterium]